MTDQKRLHIVIAEDDIDDGEIIQMTFENNSAFGKVTLVKNGKELLNFLKDEAIENPDVILTDINMPIVNGIEALQQISHDDDLRQIPAFAYSTTINPIYEAKCMEYGTKGFLIKPFDLGEYKQIPEKILMVLDWE